MSNAKEDSRAEEQARAQVESIVEMVRALDREAAAEDYAATLFEADIRSILANNEIEPDSDDLDGLRAQLAGLLGREEIESEGFEFDEDGAREAIQEDPLSVEVRSGWASRAEEFEAEEFQILLCTGGPAVRIRGEIDGERASRAWVEYQDWFTPWEELRPLPCEQETLLRYCNEFYFGA